MSYNAPLDLTSKLITNIMIAIFLVLFALQPLSPFTYIMLPTLLITWGIHPTKYLITDNMVIIKRPFGNIRLAIGDITLIEQLGPEQMGFSIRMFASGGLFGYLGIFRSDKLGTYSMWSTNIKDQVLLIVNGKKIVISPSNPQAFVLEVKNRFRQS